MPEGGDELEALFRRYSRMVHGVCQRYVKDPLLAEDLMQEVFIKAFQRLPEFRRDASPFTWLYRIAINACIDFLRSRKAENLRCEAFMEEVVLENLRHGEEASLEPLDMERILSAVDPETRQILVLHHAEGLTHEEIAQVMGVSRTVITKRLMRFHQGHQTRSGRLKVLFREIRA